MVSKTAVIAIVAILAVPILLGYALNVEQVTETDYKTTGVPVNVTSLLQQDTDYTYAYASAYELNADNFSISGISGVYPHYVKTIFAKSPLYSRIFTNTLGTATGFDFSCPEYWYYVESYYTYPQYDNPYARYLVMDIYYQDDGGINHLLNSVDNPLFFSYDDATKTLTYSRYNYGTIWNNSYTYDNIIIRFTIYNGYVPNDYGWSRGYPKADDPNNFSAYVDFSSGFRLPAQAASDGLFGSTHARQGIDFKPGTISYIITMDLSSVTDANYRFGISEFLMLEKTTTDGVVTWAVKNKPGATELDEDLVLYYDQSSTNNTYQMKVWVDTANSTPSSTPGYYDYPEHREFRYVGVWPTFIGEANYYQSYDIESTITATSPRASNVTFGGYADNSPIMRVDQAYYRSMEYSVMKDQIYKPSDFKTNPSTKIENPFVYGSSIEFGGNTYTVKKGNITMGSHDIPVKDLVLSSVPNPNGGYDNKIGNTVVSTTAQPSTIKFVGTWSASITTTAQEEYEITKTEWKAGDFAWDGIDHNFIMAGLLASLGAFIGVGIYARRTRSSVWPLLIVCGGAALLFFVML